MQDVFYFDYSMGVDEDGRFRGVLKGTGLRPSFTRRLEDLGVHTPGDLFEHEPPERR